MKTSASWSSLRSILSVSVSRSNRRTKLSAFSVTNSRVSWCSEQRASSYCGGNQSRWAIWLMLRKRQLTLYIGVRYILSHNEHPLGDYVKAQNSWLHHSVCCYLTLCIYRVRLSLSLDSWRRSIRKSAKWSSVLMLGLVLLPNHTLLRYDTWPILFPKSSHSDNPSSTHEYI